MFQGPTYWQSIKKKWATLTATTNTGRFFCTSRKFGRPRDGKPRVQFELLGLTIVDAFLACRYSMPKWKHDQNDEESFLWKFDQNDKET
jgi:hypothetical protein